MCYIPGQNHQNQCVVPIVPESRTLWIGYDWNITFLRDPSSWHEVFGGWLAATA